MTDFYGFDVRGLDGSPDILGALRGKVTVAVNVASRCGYTPQYAALEDLYRELESRGFAVVGFPCNQFGAQEPASEVEIRDFCSLTYGVTFPLAAKIEVKGPHCHPLYAWLTAKENGFPGEIGWNFEKFLIDRSGRVACRYPSGMKPTDPGFLQDIADVI